MSQDTAAPRSVAGPLGLVVVVQAALVAALAWPGADVASAPAPSLEQRLLDLDLVHSTEALDGRLLELRRSRALPREAESQARGFLSQLAVGAGFTVEDLRLEPQAATDTLAPVDAVMALAGDPYHLPIVLDGLDHFRADGLVVGLDAEGPSGGAARILLRIRYVRPHFESPGWLAERLDGARAGVDRSVPVLGQASETLAWRRFLGSEPERAALQRRVHALARRQWPSGLIALRQRGAPYHWTAAGAMATAADP